MLDRASPPRRRRKQARPRELLDAALAVFVETGFEAARTEEIAARAGVSKGTLYLYFPSKADLLGALIAERFSSRIAVQAQRAAADAGTSPELLRNVVTAWWLALMDDHAGGILKLVFTEARNFPRLAEFWSLEVIQPVRRLVAVIVERGIERGEFRPVDPDLVMRSLVLPLIMMCLCRHTLGPCAANEPQNGDPDFFRRHFDLMLEGLVRRAPALGYVSQVADDPAATSRSCNR